MNIFLRKVALLTFVFFSLQSISQTLIINEVSQGPSGTNQEYIELLVVDTSANYNCAETAPPSIDIRHWIIDDNSGYHGSSGVAHGAIRFSNDATWSAVPLGTIILLYNDADQNTQITSGVVNLSDGTCKIVAPISDAQLFENNTTTPGAAACSYPQNGWTSGGDWSHIRLRNGGDCARIVNLSGCEVFSICWGNVNQNTDIYFNGSASGKVYSFGDGDPHGQSNWTSGCTTPSNCGSQDQTPGSANNAGNTSFIGKLNNNCMPITPIQASINLIQNPYCINNGSITGSATGSIAGYTYNWYNSDFSSQVGSGDTLNSIGAGTYNLIAISSIGCDDTVSFTLNEIDTNVVLTLSDTSICSAQTINLTGSASIAGGQFNWNNQGNTSSGTFSVNVTQSQNYPVSYSLGSCSVDSTISVSLGGGQVSAGNDTTICFGSSINLTATGGGPYTWNNGVQNGEAVTPPVGQNTYTVTSGQGSNCESSDEIIVTVLPLPNYTVNLTTSSENAPVTVNFTTTSSNVTSFEWNFGNGETSSNANPTVIYSEEGIYNVELTLYANQCSTVWTQQIVVKSPINPLIVKVPNVFSPNKDGIDDEYYLPMENAQSIEAIILNRWGDEMRIFNKINDTWDGNFGGSPASEGTYFIKYKVVGLDQTIKEGHTFFQLVR